MRRAARWVRGSRRRSAAAALAVAGLVGGVILVASTGDDPASRVQTADAPTTTERSTTTTKATPSTTSTTAAETTTTAPIVTTTPPPPPTTAAAPPPPPPPPPPSTPFDANGVLSFAQERYGGTPPQTSTGARTCPAAAQRPSDAGDDGGRDIGDWYLVRYCDGTYRAAMATTEAPDLHAAWLRIDQAPGGCEGTDHVVIGWWVPNGPSVSGRAGVVATPSCDPGSWQWRDAAGYPMFNGGWIQLDFRGTAVGDPGAFDWRGYVQGTGGDSVDVVPNAGPERFVVG